MGKIDLMKILLIGQNDFYLKFIKEVFSRGQTSITFNSFDNSKNSRFSLNNVDILVIDLSRNKEIEFQQIQDIVSESKKKDISSIAFIQEDDLTILDRLIKSGLGDYLKVPFDKIEMKIRLKNLINLHKHEKDNLSKVYFSALEKSYASKIQSLLQIFKQSVPPFKMSSLIPIIANYLRKEFKLKSVLYFIIGDQFNIILKSGSPQYLHNEDIKIKLKNLPVIEKGIAAGREIFINKFQPNDTNYTFLRSFLNLDFKSLGFLPLKRNGSIHSCLIILSDSTETFMEDLQNYYRTLVDIISLGYQYESYLNEQIKPVFKKAPANSSEFLDLVINQLNFGIMVIDKNLDIKYMNESATQLLQLNSSLKNYEQLDKLLGKQNTKKILDTRKKTEGTFERPEIELTSVSGDKILIGFTTTEFKPTSLENEGFILSLKDITYSKELQEEMSRMDRLASLGVMASGIAHEIRNPLAGIKAIAQTFEEELSDNDPKNEYVRRIIKQVNRLDDMLKTLFSYAKPQKPNRQFYRMEEILQEVLSLLKQKLYKQHIKLSQSYASNLPPVYIDSSQIQQVLINLILNSLEAIEKEGEINISIEQVAEECELFKRKPFYRKITENSYIQLNISDTGCGIPQDNLQQIFNPFFTTKTFGTGLGLSIVYQIVQENNGIIYFESEENKGTSCYLFLPAFEEAKLQLKDIPL